MPHAHKAQRPRTVEPSRAIPHLAPTLMLAERAVEAAERALTAVFKQRTEPAWSIDTYQAAHRQSPWSRLDAWYVDRAIRSLFRWWGWIEPLGELPTAERLLLASLMDARTVHPVVRLWARMAGREAMSLVPLADAPSWTARTDGFKRICGKTSPNVDPWRLFPAWFRDAAVVPEGPEPSKVRGVQLIEQIQAPPELWVRAQGSEPEKVWNELRELGLKPWVHRTVATAARLGADTDLESLPPYQRGVLERHDLSAQAIAAACDPVPGQRWWITHAGAGVEYLHLASLMNNRGVVVVTDGARTPPKSLALHTRRTPFRNVSTRDWDGKHVAGKPRSFDGVLVEPPSSNLGKWRAQPELRWLMKAETRAGLPARQLAALSAAAEGVRPGGFLVYAVPTFSRAETTDLVPAFLDRQPEFRLDPFPQPFESGRTPGLVQLYPSAQADEGWFIAAFVRSTSAASPGPADAVET